jgi:hypothetical protein
LELAQAAHLAGAVATLARGGFAFAAPALHARRVELGAESALGRSEVRAIGALLASLGGFAVFVQDQVAFALLGGAWLAAGAARIAGALLAGDRVARVWRAALADGALSVLLLYPG